MNLKILAICDGLDHGPFIAHMLAKERGDTVVSTTTYTHQVLTDAERNPPDIIIIEVTQPEIDVFQVYQQLRTRPALQKIPVLFWRVANPRSMYPKAQAAGVAGCLEFMSSYDRDDLLAARDVIAEGGSYYPSLEK